MDSLGILLAIFAGVHVVLFDHLGEVALVDLDPMKVEPLPPEETFALVFLVLRYFYCLS